MLAELGVPGLLVPEKYEGMGMDEIDFVLLQEEAGRAALAEPVIETAAVAAPLLVELGSEELCDRWLEPIATGKAIAAVGHAVSPFVSDAHIADLLLLQHGDEVHAVDPEQVTLTRQPANDPSRCLFTVDWKPGDATRVAEGEKGRACLAAALDRGALACAAQQLGVADQLITMASGYAEQRHQFGKPIGSFQAIKHMLANLKVKLEYARPVVHRAAHSVARAVSGRAVHVSMAKLAASRGGHAPPRRPRFRSTARSAIPGRKTCTSGCGARGPSSWPGAAPRSIAAAWRTRFSRTTPGWERERPSQAE